MGEKLYETKTIEYLPGRKRGPGSRKKFDELLAEGWEVVSEKHRLGAVTTATLRRVKAEVPAKASTKESWEELKNFWRDRKS